MHQPCGAQKTAVSLEPLLPGPVFPPPLSHRSLSPVGRGLIKTSHLGVPGAIFELCSRLRRQELGFWFEGVKMDGLVKVRIRSQ